MNKSQLLAIVWEKSKLNLKSEATVNYLSYTWWIIEPIIHLTCYYIVFELLLDRGGPGFVYFLLTGLIPWLWFARTINQGSNSLIGGRMLMGQIFIPKLFFPLVFITQCCIKQALVFVILLVFLTATQFSPSIHWLSCIALMLVQLFFMIPLVCLIAAAVVFIRDLTFIVPTILQFMFFCSGIFFSLDKISVEYQSIFFANPVAGLIHQYREVLLHNSWPDWSYLLNVVIGSSFLWVVTAYVYHKHEYTMTRASQE